MTTRSEPLKSGERVAVTGIWLRSNGDWMEVLAEIDGQWRIVIRTYAPLNEMSVSHIVEPSGMANAPTWK